MKVQAFKLNALLNYINQEGGLKFKKIGAKNAYLISMISIKIYGACQKIYEERNLFLSTERSEEEKTENFKKLFSQEVDLELDSFSLESNENLTGADVEMFLVVFGDTFSIV